MDNLRDIFGYEKYLFEINIPFEGIQYIFHFPNNYGASVIRHFGSYGFDKGLWELAVIKRHKDDWKLNYETSITNDVVGYLSESEVNNLLTSIKEL